MSEIVNKCKRCIGKDNFCRYFKNNCNDISNDRCVWKKNFKLELELQQLKVTLDEIEEICNKYYKSQDELLKIKNKKWLYAFSKGVITGKNDVAKEILQLINQARKVNDNGN